MRPMTDVQFLHTRSPNWRSVSPRIRFHVRLCRARSDGYVVDANWQSAHQYALNDCPASFAVDRKGFGSGSAVLKWFAGYSRNDHTVSQWTLDSGEWRWAENAKLRDVLIRCTSDVWWSQDNACDRFFRFVRGRGLLSLHCSRNLSMTVSVNSRASLIQIQIRRILDVCRHTGLIQQNCPGIFFLSWNWKYGFSITLSTASRSLRPRISLISKVPSAIRTFKATSPRPWLLKCRAYSDSTSSQGTRSTIFIQRFSGFRRPQNTDRSPTILCADTFFGTLLFPYYTAFLVFLQ